MIEIRLYLVAAAFLSPASPFPLTRDITTSPGINQARDVPPSPLGDKEYAILGLALGIVFVFVFIILAQCLQWCMCTCGRSKGTKALKALKAKYEKKNRRGPSREDEGVWAGSGMPPRTSWL